jgi:PAS domain S-box-containing protein
MDDPNRSIMDPAGGELAEGHLPSVPRILIIEDEEAHIELIRRAFKRSSQQYDITYCRTMAEAREAVARSRPDLIIADWLLPDGKGVEIIRDVQQDPKVPVVFMTSHGSERLAVDLMKAGALDYFVKSEAMFADMPHIVDRALWERYLVLQRQNLERMLRQTHERLSLVLQGADIGVYEWNLVTGERIFDHVFSGILGYSPEEFRALSGSWQDFIHPDDRFNVEETMCNILNGSMQRATIEYRMRTKVGGWRWISDFIKIIETSGEGKPERLVGLRQDITWRKSSEELVRESEVRFRTLIEKMHDIVIVHDLQGNILLANEAASRLTGMGKEELLTRNISDIDPYMGVAEYRSGYWDRLNYDETVIMESAIPTTGKKQIILENSLTLISFGGRPAVLSVSRDITTRKMAEKALAQSEHWFRALIENSSEIFRVLDMNGIIIYDSPSSSRILGYSEGFTHGKSPLDFVHPDDVARVRADIEAVYRDDVTGTPERFRMLRADGRYITVEAVTHNLLDVDEVKGIVVTILPV